MKIPKNITSFFGWYYYLTSFFGGKKHKADFSEIKKYILFIGYPRSGHSLIGSLLDAHPNMMVSNQLNALSFFAKGYSRQQVFYLIRKNSEKHDKAGRSNSGYNYVVPEQWQGRYRRLIGIGDKGGGRSTEILNKTEAIHFLEKIQEVSQAKLKIIHIIRNPYDNISTMVLRQVKHNGKDLTEELFENKIASYFRKVETNAQIKKGMPNVICDVHLEDFIANPEDELQRIFDFLEIDTTTKYLKNCASIIWAKTNKSRSNLPLWTSERIQQVLDCSQQYEFLRRYSFDDRVVKKKY